MTGPSSGGGGSLLLSARTSFTNLIIAGKNTETVRPLFFGDNLVDLEKKGGEIRPIAAGCTLRRLAAKAAASRVGSPMNALLAPRQLGCGTPRGQRLQCMLLVSTFIISLQTMCSLIRTFPTPSTVCTETRC